MKYLVYISLALFLAACASTQRVSWETGTSNGIITLPDGTKNVALLSRVNLSYPPTDPDELRQYTNHPDAVHGLLTGFYNEIYNRRYLNFIGTFYNFQTKANGQFPKGLDLTQVQAASNSADILVSLEMVDQWFEDKYTIDIRKKKMGDNLFSEEDYVIGRRTIKVIAGWKVYNGVTGEVLDSFRTEEDHFYEAEDLERIRVTELLNQNFNRELKNIGLRLGYAYGVRVSPKTHSETRVIYNTGSQDLEDAGMKIRDEKWDEAAEIWKTAVENEKRLKVKAMLYHNLAIYEERRGNIDQAREYAKLAANHHKLGQSTMRVIGS